MESKTTLQLLNYKFKTLEIAVNENFKWPDTAVSMDPIITKTIQKIDKDNVKVILTFNVPEDENKPFSALVQLIAYFNCPNWETSEFGKTYVSINTINIMFPYLRQAVTTLTSLSGLPAYVMPVMNINYIKEEK